VPETGHPLANGAAVGFAERSGVFFQAGRIDAQLLCGPEVLRTSEPAGTWCGLAQVRRLLAGVKVRVLHVVFAPQVPRPLLLALVRIANESREPHVVDYTEMWQIGSGEYATGPGAAELSTPAGRRALAEVSSAIRAHAPEAEPAGGLALDLRIPIPAGAVRELAFAYAAPGPEEDPGAVVRAFRGRVREELLLVTRHWLRSVDPTDPVADYRRRAATLAACAR
jgi:hypothetical protein